MTARYIDAHCHVDRYPSPPETLDAAAAAGVVVVAVTELPSHYQRLALRLGRRPQLRLALGLHPLRAREATGAELTLFSRLLDRTDYVGEVGLDGSQHGKATLTAQRKVFAHVLSQPRIRTKALTVHSRGAEEEVVERLAAAGAVAALHWYTGALKHIAPALDAGLWFSVNTAMTKSKSGQRILSELPPGRVITETDGPWTILGGRPSRPDDVPALVRTLAGMWNEDVEEARERVFDNMATFVARARDAPA